MIKKIFVALIVGAFFVVFFNFNTIKNYFRTTEVILPNDISSISDQRITIDTQTSPKIILSSSMQSLEKLIPLAEILQNAISKNEIQIQNVFLIVFDVSEKEKSIVISFLEKNNIYLQTVVDSNNLIKTQFKTEPSVSILSKNQLVWDTIDPTELSKQNLKNLLKP